MTFAPIARRLGIASAWVSIVLLVAFAVTLTVGLLSLASSDDPIRGPMFSMLEILIILLMPGVVTLMVVSAAVAWPRSIPAPAGAGRRRYRVAEDPDASPRRCSPTLRTGRRESPDCRQRSAGSLADASNDGRKRSAFNSAALATSARSYRG
jgi:hypothetical protein